MTSPASSSPSVGRFTSLVLATIVSLCLIMIGVAGFLKYQLDRAETALAAPDAALASGQDMSAQLRRALGYSGFLGAAQTFLDHHDPAALTEMKAQLKAASDIASRLSDRISTETRRDLQAILTGFQNVADKADRAATDPATVFSSTDLIPLYAALPIMDARVETAAASSRLAAQSQLQFWSMLLTLIAWASLIIASAMAVNVYLSLRDRNSAPLRALAQSVKNMAHGDMRTPIWGMERQDMIGELARTIDQARFQFSQLPDIALLSDNGPLRLRFEGQSRSLFDAMMQRVGGDAEKLREQTGGLTDAIGRQEEAISLISSRVEAVLHNVEKRGLDGDQQVKRAVQNIASSADALIHAQQHATEQLGRLLPFMRERAQGLADIAQLTGKQAAAALQSLVVTERGLRSSAEQSSEAIKKLSTTADELGNRLFGAVNLLQASGKVLSETTEKTQSRLNEVLIKFSQTGQNFVMPAVTANTEPQQGAIDKTSFDYMLASLEALQNRLEERVNAHAEATQAQIDLLITQSSGLLTQTSTAAQTLSAAGDHLRSERAKFDEALKDIVAKLQQIGMQAPSAPATAAFSDTSLLSALAPVENLKAEITALCDKIVAMDAHVKSLPTSAPDLLSLTAQMADSFRQTTAAFGSLRSDIAALDHNLQTVADRARPMAQLSDQLSNGFGTTTLLLSDLRSDMTRLDQTMRETGQPKAATFLAEFTGQLTHGFDRMAAAIDGLKQDLGQLASVTAQAQTAPIHDKEIQERWYQLASQIEATRSDLTQLVTQQVDRLSQQLSAQLNQQGQLSAPPVQESDLAARTRDTQRQMEQQTQILTELVTTLGVLDAHIQQLKSEMHAARG